MLFRETRERKRERETTRKERHMDIVIVMKLETNLDLQSNLVLLSLKSKINVITGEADNMMPSVFGVFLATFCFV